MKVRYKQLDKCLHYLRKHRKSAEWIIVIDDGKNTYNDWSYGHSGMIKTLVCKYREEKLKRQQEMEVDND